MKRPLLVLACALTAAADNWVQPFPLGAVHSPQPPVGAYFSAETDPSALRMTLDGRDLTAESRREAGRILWTPQAPLPAGPHSATLNGPGVRRTWSFVVGDRPLATLQTAPAQGELTSLQPTITLRFSEPVQKVRFLLDGLDVPAQAPSGGDAVRYMPLRPLKTGSHAVQIFARGADGSLLEKSWTFVASAKVLNTAMVVLQPAAGKSTGRQPRIRFSLPPGKTHERFTMTLDGADVTDECVQLGRAIQHVPGRPLAVGSHKVSVRTRSIDGVEFERTWSFAVR